MIGAIVSPVSLALVQNGAELPTFCIGDTFALVPEDLGEYAVRLTNHFNRDVLCVLSVDGVNAVDGEAAELSRGGGYVIEPGGSLLVPGWRRGDEEVAAFSFQAAEGSYAAQTGRGTANTGVIGCAVFLAAPHLHRRENILRTQPPWPTKADGGILRSAGLVDASYSADSPQTLSCDVPRASLTKGARVGTAYGRKVEHQVRSTHFRKESSTPNQVITLRYATRSWLEANGIVVPAFYATPRPQAFPGQGCPPPPGWQG